MNISRLNNYALILKVGILGLLIGLVPAEASAEKADYAVPGKIRVSKDNATTPERAALGKALFFDPRLSGSNWISCGTCHNPTLGWSDGLPTAIGEGQKVLGRATPTILNTAYNRKQFWDGRARDLEHQAVGPIQASGEMNQDMAGLIDEIKQYKGYVEMFDKAYPGEGINEKTIGKAIAAFERTIVTKDSPFDRWINGDENAISTAAKRGFEVFDREDKGNCSACHQGYNFVDDGFHNIGLPNTNDEGRYKFVKVAVLKGAFKTPTLRDITRTAPYMHNGAYATLEEVVEHYNKGGVVKDNLDPNMKPLHLSKREKQDLVEFLKTLTGDAVDVTYPVLPTKF